jgi:glycerophosphoryl diester phosphodiesterase
VTAWLDFTPPVIGHRGACGYRPENTMSSFIKAQQLGIKWVEFDVRLSACHEAILLHDHTLDRTSNGRGYVEKHPYHYLQTLDAGSWFGAEFKNERILRLNEVLSYLASQGMAANIEIKPYPGHEVEIVQKVLNIVEPYLAQQQLPLIFSSFSLPVVKRLRQLSSSILLGFLMDEWLDDWQALSAQYHCVSLHLNQAIVTETIANQIKQAGKYLLCYTVNDYDRAQELYAWGVDAVFSDFPDRVIKAK